MAAPRIKPILAIFITVLIDMLGFAMFIPDIQLRGKHIAHLTYGPNLSDAALGTFIGLMLASFSIAQLLTAPILGRISDIYGRRSVLLLSTLLSVGAYLIYGFVESATGIFLARILSGIAAANLGVAFAYVADTTKPEDRAKSLGLLGAAFGIGFIIGPVLGALLLNLANDKPTLLGIVTSVLCLVNFIFIWTSVPESVKKSETPATRPSPIADLRRALTTPGLNLTLFMFFAYNLCFVNLETTYFRLIEDKNWIFRFEDPKTQGAYVLLVVGLVGAFVQGYLIRIFSKKYGELKTLRMAYLLFVPAFALVPFTPMWFPGVIGILALGLASGLAQPSLNSIISRTAPATMQGGIFGIMQALGAVARAVGPLISHRLYSVQPYAPYVLGAVLALFPTVAAWMWLKMPDDVTHQAH